MGAIYVEEMLVVDSQGGRHGEGTDDEVADEDLQDLGAQTGAALEGLLQSPYQDVAERSADKGTVGGHLGNARGEVVAVLVAVFGEKGSDELLGTGQGAGREHLGPHRVLLELVDIDLGRLCQQATEAAGGAGRATYHHVALGASKRL